MKDFSSFGLDADLLRAVADCGFTRPTPIQIDAMPPALAGRDVLACAMTGSGKTAAFALPILQRLKDKPRGTTRALVVTPTRELAAQIAEHLAALATHTSVTSAVVYGGVAAGPQERAFRQGVDVLVATPGRLLDHLQHPYARLDEIEVLVLDEADRMLDMGFLPDVRRILGHLPRERQTLFYSATLPPPIVALSREMLRDAAAFNVERRAEPAVGITQAIYPIREDLKSWLLLELLRRGEIASVLVFTRTKHRANRVADFLDRNGIACGRIHGNRSQAQRTDALARFKDGRLRVLVATDIAARGLDVEALSHVINFDIPKAPDDYIHRVGRTARAELTGDAFTFVSPQDAGELAAIERAVGRHLPRRTLAGFDYEARPAERLEIPLGERIAAIRARKTEERARAHEKAQRRQAQPERTAGPARQGSPRGAGRGTRDTRRSPQAANGPEPRSRTAFGHQGRAGDHQGGQAGPGRHPGASAGSDGRGRHFAEARDRQPMDRERHPAAGRTMDRHRRTAERPARERMPAGDPQLQPADPQRLGDTETRTARAVQLFRPRLYTRLK